MSWKFIRLELGRTGEFPSGSVGRAYLLRLPLNDQDEIDTHAFNREPHKATVRRQWSMEPDQRGHIMRNGRDWQMYCAGQTRRLQLDSRPVRLGEQFSVVGDDGIRLPFRVASIR